MQIFLGKISSATPNIGTILTLSSFARSHCSQRQGQNPDVSKCSWFAQNLKRCENVPTEWHCSSYNHRNSFCVRLCPTSEQIQENPSHDFGNLVNHHSESIKCRCRNRECQWEHKGRKCFSESTFKDSYLEFVGTDQGETDDSFETEDDKLIRIVFKKYSSFLISFFLLMIEFTGI